MGVQGLLPKLKSVMHEVDVAKYRGKTVGIDAAMWLYKGCYSCAADVVMGKDTDAYLNFSLQQIKLLQRHEIRPLFVFDGAPLPAKGGLNAQRYKARKESKQKALGELGAGGDDGGSRSAFNKAVSVSNDMIMKLIAVLRRMDIQFIVAPYEADAQLAYLSKHKIVDAVISEDSDCIPYGCRTILFKWNEAGWASELKRRSLGANEDLSFLGWNEEMFIQMCVLCGCDYCPSVQGVGIANAYKLVSTHKKPLEVIAALKQWKAKEVPEDYSEKFFQAVLTFRHHLVFDPRDEKLKMLNPLTVSSDILKFVDEELRFLGDMELKDDVVASIAHGIIHPQTHESYAWKETAEMQSITPSEDGSKSMTSSETSSLADVRLGHRGILSRPDSAERENRVVPVTDDEGNRVQSPASHQSNNKPPLTTWRHLDGVLGNSPHILNFRSPKVSENFRSLVSSDTRRLQFHAGTTADNLKAFEDVPCRPSLKRVRNPKNRNRENQTSGFDGEVTCRVDLSDQATQRLTQKRRLAEEITADTPRLVSLIEASKSHSYHRHHPFATIDPHSSERGMKLPIFRPNNQIVQASSEPGNWRDPRVIVLSDSEEDIEEVMSRSSSMPRPTSIFNALTAKRAVSAEEKWDRILENEIGSNSGSDEEDAASRP